MGILFGRGARVTFTTAPRDVVVREQQIENIDAAIAEAQAHGCTDRVDYLLDARNAMRPARPAPSVPVIPGRP